MRNVVELTLDANLIHDLLKEPRKGRPLVMELLRLSDAGEVDLAVTTTIKEDIPRDPLATRLAELPELGVRTVGSVFRLGISQLDGLDMVGDDLFVSFSDRVHRRALETRARVPDERDFDHLHGHMLNRRDVFLTRDGPILELAGQLWDYFAICVMKPEDWLDGHRDASRAASRRA